MNGESSDSGRGDRLISWASLEADQGAFLFLHEFGYFTEYVLGNVSEALAERLLHPDAFGSHNLRVVITLGSLNKYLALAVHSYWEPHFRRWLAACAIELGNVDLAPAMKRMPLDKLFKQLEHLRGLPIDALPGGSRLRELALVGNVVRHGDGPSAARLQHEVPDIWLGNAKLDASPGDSWSLADDLTISDQRLHMYAEAVFEFWRGVVWTRNSQLPRRDPPWMKDDSH